MSEKEKAFVQQIAAEVALYQKEVLNSEEASRLLGITKSRLYTLTSARRIPHFKAPGGKYNYFNRTEILNWAQSNRVATIEELNDRAQTFARR